VECLLEAKKFPKTLTKITDRSVAAALAQLMIKKEYFHRSEKIEGKKGNLMVGFTLPFSFDNVNVMNPLLVVLTKEFF